MCKKTKEVAALPESLQMITGEWFLVNPSYVDLDKVLFGNHLDDFQGSKWRKRLGCDENKDYIWQLEYFYHNAWQVVGWLRVFQSEKATIEYLQFRNVSVEVAYTIKFLTEKLVGGRELPIDIKFRFGKV